MGTELENTNTDLNYTSKKLQDTKEQNEQLRLELKNIHSEYSSQIGSYEFEKDKMRHECEMSRAKDA